MKTTLFLLIAVSFLHSQERYSKVLIPVANRGEYIRLASLGVAVDHYVGKIGDKISVFLSETELKELDNAGISYSVQIRDWQEYYNHSSVQKITASHQSSVDTLKYFHTGSKNGFLTLSEIEYDLYLMRHYFTWLISEKIEIGTTHENRKIYAVKISDNPDIDESTEPEVLYTALHHAREPQGMMTLVYYMWWLLEKHSKNDPEAKYLVNNRQMWFILAVNPDGYEFNGPGGMWRKNRRDNGDGSFGIDLNRNYGPFQMWNAPNGGSSTLTTSETYRGISPFSEPETNAIQNFMKSRNIRLCLNYHTYGDYLIYPWGYASKETDDSLLFRYWTYEMTGENRYTSGTDLQTVHYSTRGNSDDFMYGDTSKPVTYAMTPEVGYTFWPSESAIYPLAFENLLQNKLLAHYAGAYLEIRSFVISKSRITVRLVNKGLEDVSNLQVHLSTQDGIVPATFTIDSIPSFSEKDVEFDFESGDQPPPHPVRIFLQDISGGILRDSIRFIRGTPTVLISDSAASTALWSTGTSWGIYVDPLTGSSSFADSPNGTYSSAADNSLTLLSPIDLTGYQYAELKFKTTWAIEPVWDFATIEISTNNGATWSVLRTQLSRKGSGKPHQPVDSYGYDAYTPGLSWREQTVDLTPFVSKHITIRFRLASDPGDQRDGWYLDDIRIFGYSSPSLSVEAVEIPHTFSLSQNYPNPFNPVTRINYGIPRSSFVTLYVHDVLGRKVAEVVNGYKEAGNHTAFFDAAGVSSGIYFYRLTTGAHTAVKTMTVIK